MVRAAEIQGTPSGKIPVGEGGIVYPVSELARRHHASVGRETHKPDEAYADVADDRDVGYRTGWLPG